MKTAITTEIIPEPLPKNLGFFKWQGNQYTFKESSWLFYLFIAIVLAGVLLFWIFRKQILESYQQKQKIFGINKVLFWRIFGIISFIIFGLRMLLLGLNGYPNRWEIIPLHFCRFFIVLIGLMMIFNKLEWIRYIVFWSVVGAFIAFGLSDLSSNERWRALTENHSDVHWGMDNYVFWDFLLAHSYAIVLSIIPFILANKKISFKDSLISFGGLVALGVSLFIVNYLTTFSADKHWWANWFYFGVDEVNSVKNNFGQASHWPWHILTYMALFIGIAILCHLWYFFQAKIYLQKNQNNHLRFVFKKSITWEFWKQSFRHLKLIKVIK